MQIHDLFYLFYYYYSSTECGFPSKYWSDGDTMFLAEGDPGQMAKNGKKLSKSGTVGI